MTNDSGFLEKKFKTLKKYWVVNCVSLYTGVYIVVLCMVELLYTLKTNRTTMNCMTLHAKSHETLGCSEQLSLNQGEC